MAATAYVIDSGGGTPPTYASLVILEGGHATAFSNGDSIEFKNTDATLTNPFSIADGTTLTLSGVNKTISRASGSAYDTTRFINTLNSFNLLAANDSTIIFDGFGATTNNQYGGVLYGYNITLGAAGSTGTLVFSNNSAADRGGAIYAYGDLVNHSNVTHSQAAPTPSAAIRYF